MAGLSRHRRTRLLRRLLLLLNLLLLPRLRLLLLLEVLHRLRPLRTALLHRRTQRLHRIDLAMLVEEVITCAGRPLSTPECTGVLAEGDLVGPMQAGSSGGYGQSRRQLVASLVRHTAILLVELVNQIARFQIERVIRMGWIIQAARA